MKFFRILATALVVLFAAAHVEATCWQTSWPWSPIDDATAYTYAGHDMGLYGGQSNTRPAAIEALAQTAVATIPTETTFGVVLIGQSTATTEFAALLALPGFQSAKGPHVVVVNGAHPGYEMEEWSSTGSIGWTYLATQLTAAGITASQVRVVILISTFPVDYQAHLTDVPARFAAYATRIRQFRDATIAHLPNVAITYAAGLHPLYAQGGEPAAGYETQLAFRDAMLLTPIANDPPFLAPFSQWSQGATPTAAGVSWICGTNPATNMYTADGVHLVALGNANGAPLILNWLLADSTTGWFKY